MDQQRVKYRAVRRHRNRLAIEKQLRIIRHYRHLDLIHAPAIGRYRKGRAMGCPNARCYMCTNPRRMWGQLTLQEIENRREFQRQMKSLDM